MSRPEIPAGTGRPRWRTPWLLLLLVVLLVTIPIAEVALLITVGQQIGLLPTVVILVVEAVLGAWLVKREGGRALTALTKALQSGSMPSGELADAALILVGGTLLIVPGFVTDVFGLVFLLPFTRPFARRALGWLVARQVHRRLGIDPGVLRARMDREGTIEGEVVPEPRTDRGPQDPAGPNRQLDR